jgi:hypothetical protein
MVRWVQRFPGRLEWELAEFKRRGLDDFALDDEGLQRGRVVLNGSISRAAEHVHLQIVFPDTYPYFRPEVFAPELLLGRHQNPYARNLCLLEASTRAWGTSDTAAWLVDERVPFLLDLIEMGGSEMERNEVPQGEPESVYVVREHGSAIFISEDALRLPDDALFGDAYFSFSPDRVGPAVHLLLRQLNARTKSGVGKPLAHADERLCDRFGGLKLEGRWVRVAAIPGLDSEEYFAVADRVKAGFGTPPWQNIGDADVAILGVVFKEEVRQGVWEDAWVFAVRWRTTNPGQFGSYLTQGERFAAEDMFARVPRLQGLEVKDAALVGLGSLGAPLALELARAQVGDLRVLDHDLVEGGTIVRWPVGLPAVGSFKTAVIEGTIKANYPRTLCQSFVQRLGAARPQLAEAMPNDFDVLARMFEGADLVIDATGEIAIQQLVADLARERALPQVFVWATEGAFGGAVVRCIPERTGCWFCLQLAIQDGSIEAPPREEIGTTQPRGCATPTFTGESFNLLPLVAQAARVVVGTLLDTLPIGQDAFVMSFTRDGNEQAGAPTWTTSSLEKHPRCSVCGPGE